MHCIRMPAMFLLVLSSIAACTLLDSDDDGTSTATDAAPPTEDAVPTVASVEMFATAYFLTENAPPPGFGEVHFASLDAHLSRRSGWAAVMSGHFTGTFDDTGEPAEGTFEAQVQADVLGERRRVVLLAEGDAVLPDESPLRLESVRISNDYFLVDTNGICTAGGDEIGVVADLSAADLIGGVSTAVPTGHRNTLEGVPAWQYTFVPQDVVLPTSSLKLSADSTVAIEADLWVSPDYDIVLRYEMTLQVQKVRVFSGERPVSGTLYLRYEIDISQLDVLQNIPIPHGC